MGREDRAALQAYFAEQGQVLLPMLELIEDARASIDELMAESATMFVEQLLVLSAIEVAGERRPGKGRGEVRWHGRQRGRIVLAERKLNVQRPRLRAKGAPGREVPIPVYERLLASRGWAGASATSWSRACRRASTAPLLPSMAGTVGISKSSVSSELMARRFDDADILAIYLDGIVFDAHHILAAVGVATTGVKHLLGLASGSSENAAVVKDLLAGLIERGLSPEKHYLFVIDGSKALRLGIEALFGERALVQRCRVHKVGNVTERLPRDLAGQVKSVMHAAYKLPEKEGIAKLKQQATWLQSEHPDAAASLLEGLEETFTVNRLKLTDSLMRCLTTTNIIENPNGRVREVTRRVARYRDAQMALRWSATGFLEAEKRFRKIVGHKDLWMLEVALGRRSMPVARRTQSA